MGDRPVEPVVTTYLQAGLQHGSRVPVPAPATPQALLAALDRVRDADGDAGVFRVGRVAPAHTAHACHFYLLNAAGTAEAARRVDELQRRLHPEPWVRVTAAGAQADLALCAGASPTIVTFAAGLSVGLAALLGCEGVGVTVDDHVLYDVRGFHPPEPGRRIERWRLTWDRHVPREVLPAMDGWLHAQLPPPFDDVVGQVRHRVAQAPERPWTLARMGSALGRSPRALQRALSAAGTTFSGILWDARTRTAAALLQQGRTLADAATAAGFSDASHLSRRLRRAG